MRNLDAGLIRKRHQSSYYKFVQRTKGNYVEIIKGRYHDNVISIGNIVLQNKKVKIWDLKSIKNEMKTPLEALKIYLSWQKKVAANLKMDQ